LLRVERLRLSITLLRIHLAGGRVRLLRVGRLLLWLRVARLSIP